MYNDNEASITVSQRKYLLNQLYDLRDAKRDDLRKTFHMEPVGPTTIKDFLEWVKADNFEMKKEFESTNWTSFPYYIKWVDKVNKPDEDGYAKADEALKKAYTDAERVIRIKSPEAGLDALTAFESATFH